MTATKRAPFTQTVLFKYFSLKLGLFGQRLMPGLGQEIHVEFFFFFGCALVMQKLLGQGSNPRHSSNDARSLTSGASRECPRNLYRFLIDIYVHM